MKTILAITVLAVAPFAVAPNSEAQQPPPVARAEVKWGIGPRVPQFRMPLESKSVKGAPYSADVLVESVQALADGNQIVRRTTGRIYRDAEGRVRREEHPKDANSPGAISITDPVAGHAYTLDARSRVARRSTLGGGTFNAYKIVEAEPKKWLKPGDDDVKKTVEMKVEESKAEKVAVKIRAEYEKTEAAFQEYVHGAKGVQAHTETLGPTSMEGVMVEGHRTTTVIPAGQVGNREAITIVSEEWYSPELQVLVMTKHRDPRIGESTYKLTNIVRAEPPRTLFDVPPGYVVEDIRR